MRFVLFFTRGTGADRMVERWGVATQRLRAAMADMCKTGDADDLAAACLTHAAHVGAMDEFLAADWPGHRVGSLAGSAHSRVRGT